MRPLYYALATRYNAIAGRRFHNRGADKHRVAIVCPILLPGADAVSNDALGMHEAIAAEGVGADLYVARPRRTLEQRVLSIGARLAGYGLVIHHYMAFMPHLTPIFRWPTRLVLKYHNITPGSFFEGYSDEYRHECDNARAGLPALLRALPDAYVHADSEFNRGELLAMGVRETRAMVVPPFHQIDKLLRLRPEGVRVGEGILAVGRIVPNKGLDTMIAAFARVVRARPAARLNIVGAVDDRLSAYYERLRRLVDELGLGARVTFHGGVSQEVLAGLYAGCACFWTCSQHEGFCVPAIEAMAFGKPIVSTRAAALPDTCGEAALYGDDEGELASMAYALLSKPALRERLGGLARERYEREFAIDRIAARFRSAIAPHLPEHPN